MTSASLIEPEAVEFELAERSTAGRASLAVVPALLVVRGLVLLAGILSLYVAHAPSRGYGYLGVPWIAWDCYYYLNLILHGYPPAASDGSVPEIVAFFPLYPILCRTLTGWMAPETAMLVVSNACSLVGLGFLHSWVRGIGGTRVAAVCVLLAATYPGAVFFSAGLTEGPFFLLATMVLWLLQRERFYLAAVIAALATAMRPTGVAVALVVPVYAMLRRDSFGIVSSSALWARIIVLALVALAGAIAYQTFVWTRYGRIDAYRAAQYSWVHKANDTAQAAESSGAPARYSLAFFADRISKPQAWNCALAVVIAGIVLIGLYRPGGVPRAFLLVPIVIFLLAIIPDRGLRLSSIVRFESAAAPLFAVVAFWLARPGRAALLATILIVQFTMQLYYAWLFSRGIWIG